MARSLGLTPRTTFFISAVCKNSSTVDTTLAGSSSSSELGVLIPLRLDHYMSRTKPHPVGNRLLVAAIEQTQRDQQQVRDPNPGPARSAAVPRGLRHRLRQLIFARRRALLTVRPCESLPSAESERLARPDRAQRPELSRPARGGLRRRRENPGGRTRGAPPLLPPERSPRR